MAYTESETNAFKKKVERYKEILENTQRYREAWQTGLRQTIIDRLKELAEAGGLECEIEERNDIENLEAVVLTLGHSESGLGEPVGGELRRDLIKQNGSLGYQQLFNGKILVLINFPYIEKYGQPQPPKTIAIYRPEELKDAYILRHIETFMTDITNWEDYDDDLPEPNQRIGFKMNFEQDAKAQ
ncbi:MAG: hypothetical protein KF734_09845 [Saprospiraceae bacterium]|nr:hypothetical protein [Saprospiraceae bacterium]